MRVLRLSFVAAFVSLLAMPASAGWQEASDAYDRGDLETAFVEWSALANAGEARSQHELGMMYQLGDGVEADIDEAIRFFTMAAEQGYARSMTHLGNLCRLGVRGVEQNYVEAYKWYALADDHGARMIERRLGQVAEHLTFEEISEAERLALAWTEAHALSP